jgi:hypothetical protein
MQLTCMASLIACALSEPGYIAQRHFVLDVPYDQAVARLVPEDNQRRIYLACDADLQAIENESLEVFPLPLRIRRRARFRLRLPLNCRPLESVERVEMQDGKMTVTTALARSDWKVRQLNVKFVLTRAEGGKTRVSTYATLQVNGFGRRWGCLLSSVTVERLECGIRWATRPDE